jgi:LmbE family N-acetylglucosaminyl deacetylase
MKLKKYIYSIIVTLISASLFSQKPEKPSAVQLFHQIEKLNFLGSVLYIAAHPDDENTKLISYLSNEKHARTGYLSLTRGDGGQNLIGPELRELLGVIRTQELIEARKIDGGEQFFTRANDFGFSKVPDETLQIWDKDKVLSDMVWVIRNFKPDVIINRFDHRTSGTTHGHHTTSAMLSVEAFDKVNDASVFSDQLKLTQIWQPKRLFFNTSWWFFGSKEKFEAADKTNFSELKTGVYYDDFGKSNQEIAALSRSCHQSQGFGNTGTRGDESEYIELIKGPSLENKSDIFEGIDTSWNRIKNGKEIGNLIDQILMDFNYQNPSKSIPKLTRVYSLIEKIDDEHWKKIKLEELKKIIAACSGLYLEAVSSQQEAIPGEKIKIKLETINRSETKMVLKSINATNLSSIIYKPIILNNNQLITQTIDFQINTDEKFTQPYYLESEGSVGMYSVSNQKQIGIPDVIRNCKVFFTIEIEGKDFVFEKEIVYKYNDDVKGEVYQPLDIVPIATSSIKEKVYLFTNNKEKQITISIKAGKNDVSGTIKLDLPDGWKSAPEKQPFIIEKKGETQEISFFVTPSKEDSEGFIKSILEIENQVFEKEKIDINYPHIYKQMVLKPSEAKVIKSNLIIVPKKIAYIMGAGDEVPKSLQEMGYEVTVINPETINRESLMPFDVVITGIRAYNVVKELDTKQCFLLDFIASGKTMIVQYNTLDDLVTNQMAPFPLKISRDRVTEENAKVTFLDPNHPIINFPNKLTPKDFEGWKQEQGLYYPNQWDKNFTALFESNDKNESPKKGALLTCTFGKGNYIYTGFSFFRELPEGVVGAYRLMANLISY